MLLTSYNFDIGCSFCEIPLDCFTLILMNLNSLSAKKYACFICNRYYTLDELTNLSATYIRTSSLHDRHIECNYCKQKKGKKKV